MRYTIGEFAKKIGISTDTLRYYEKEELLRPNRAENNHRIYSEQDIRWMQAILRLKETHMPIKQIKQYAMLYAKGDETLKERGDMLRSHQKMLKATIKKWQKHNQNLQEKINNYETKCAGLGMK